MAERERLLVLDILESYVREHDAHVRIMRELDQRWYCRLWPHPVTGVRGTARVAILKALDHAGVEIPR